MTSTGVRETNSNERRVIKGLIKNEEAFIQSLRVFANTSTLSGLGATGGEISNSPNEPSGNYLAKSGDTMIGQFGNNFDTIAATNLADDTLNVSKSTGITFPVVILQGEGLLDDDLVTIIQGEDVFPFQELWIRTRVNIITVKNSDNVNTPDGNDLILPVGSIIKLIFDTILGEWAIVGGTPFFNTGGLSPLTTKGDLFGFDIADARIPVGTDGQVLTADSSNSLGVSWQAGGSFSGLLSDLVIDVDKNWNGKNITNLDDLVLVNSNSLIDMKGGTLFNFGLMLANNSSSEIKMGAGTIDMENGIIQGINTLTNSTTIQVTQSFDMNAFNLNNVDDIVLVNANSLIDMSAGTLFNFGLMLADSSLSEIKMGGGTIDMEGGIIIAGGATKQINNIGELAFINNTLTPAGNGIIFFDGTDLKAKTGATTVNFSNLVGQTPWLQNINGGGFNLNNVDDIVLVNANSLIDMSAGTLFNFGLMLADSSLSEIKMGGGTIDMEGGDINNIDDINGIDDIIFNGSGSIINLNGGKITNLADPTVNQDGATKFYVDSKTTFDGVQDAETWITHETSEFDFEVFVSNSKQGRNITDFNASATDDTIYFVPIFLARRTRITKFGFSLGGIPSGVFTAQMGIYSNRTDGQNYPETRLLDDSTVFSATTGAKILVPNSTVDLEAGLYWLALIWISPSTLPLSTYALSAANTAGYYLETGLSPDQILPIFGYVTTDTSLPVTVADDMIAMTLNPPCLFAKGEFNPN